MPVHAIGSNRHFRHQVGSTHRDTRAGSTAQRDPAYDSVFYRNLLLIEEVTERLSLGVGRNRGRQAYSKAMRTSALNAFTGARPCAGPAMKVVQLWRRAVQADLQDNSITRQGSQAFLAAS